MPLNIYGNLHSSAFRVVWAAEELGLAYQLVEIAVEDCPTNKQLATLNPNKKIPVIDDDGVVLWESMAINLSLARMHRGALAPEDEIEDARMQMWALWVSNECVADCMAVLANTILLPEQERSSELVEAALERLQRPLGVLNAHLSSTGFVVGERFTIGGLNVASVIGWLTAAGTDLSEFPNVVDWLKRCSERPAARKCSEMAGGP